MANLLYSNDTVGQYPDSWYAATANTLPEFAPLRGSMTADVCVIGGGFTGLSTALHLAERGYSVSLVEAHRVGWGASGRNGGQVGSGQRVEQSDLVKMLGADDARHLWAIAEDAKDTLKALVQKHSIACDLRPGVAHVDCHARDVPHAYKEAEFLAKEYGYDQLELLDHDAVRTLVGSAAYHGGTLDWGAAHVHPLNFALGLAQACVDAGVQIYEQSAVTQIAEGARPTVVCQHGKIDAQNVVLACNGYLGGLDPTTAAKVMPINNFIVATEPLGDMAEELISKDVAIADSKFVVNYFRRSRDNRMLFGGGESYGYTFPKDIRALVTKPMLEIYPQLKDVKLDYAWGGTLAITINRMPNFDVVSNNIWTASGYSGHGVAMATMAGKILAAAIAGQTVQFDLMAKVPIRRFPGGGAFCTPLLALAMTWYAARDRLGL